MSGFGPLPADERVLALCQALVSRESLSGQEGRVAEVVLEAARALGFDDVERDELGSVIATRRGHAPGRTVVFDAHMDVVPATSPERWRFGPFSATRCEGRIWGRGATDIKGSLAAMLVALGTLPKERFTGRLVASAGIGEERMEGLALGHLLDRLQAEAERPAVVICEPTQLRIGLGHKGRASLVVTGEGRPAHTSRPEEGINAVYRVAEAIPRLRALALPLDGLLGRGVMELVEISSAPYPNSSMVPYLCEARFDRRLVRGETRAGVLAELEGALAGLQGLAVRYHRSEMALYTGRVVAGDVFHPCWTLPPKSAFAQRASASLESAGQQGAFFHAPYCTNGSCSAGERGLETLIYGAGDIREAHAVDESVAEEELIAAARGYRALAEALTATG